MILGIFANQNDAKIWFSPLQDCPLIAPYYLLNRLKPATEGGGFGIMFVRGGVVICVL